MNIRCRSPACISWSPSSVTGLLHSTPLGCTPSTTAESCCCRPPHHRAASSCQASSAGRADRDVRKSSSRAISREKKRNKLLLSGTILPNLSRLVAHRPCGRSQSRTMGALPTTTGRYGVSRCSHVCSCHASQEHVLPCEP